MKTKITIHAVILLLLVALVSSCRSTRSDYPSRYPRSVRYHGYPRYERTVVIVHDDSRRYQSRSHHPVRKKYYYKNRWDY